MTDIQKEQIYTDFHNKVFGYIQSKVKNMQIAEDLASDVFVKVYERINVFDEKKASLSTWIYLITKNTLIDYYRTRKEHSELPEQLSASSSVEESVCTTEMLDALAKALEELEEREKRIVIQHFYEGATLKEIAKQMDISYSYVKLLLNKAIGKLKKSLIKQ